MDRNVFGGWLGKKSAGSKNKLGKARSLRCESLEDRRLLAVVSNLNDAGAGSLRDAIATEPAGGTVTFSVSGTISLATSLVVNKSLTIDGAGQNVIVSGNNAVRVFSVTDGVAGTFADVTMKSFQISDGSSATDGGGIQSFENLRLEGMTISNNKVTGAGQDGGGIAQGSETLAGGALTILGSTIENNTAIDDGAAIDAYNVNLVTIDKLGSTPTTIKGNLSGGPGVNSAGIVGAIRIIDAVTPALYAPNTVSIKNLVFQNNRVEGSTTAAADVSALGGILISAPGNSYAGGGGWNLTVADSTFSGNTHVMTDAITTDTYYADGRGGALYLADLDTVTISNSTFTGNYSYGDGGAMTMGVADATSNITLNNVTITGNGTGATGLTLEGGALWPINFTPGTAGIGLNLTVNNSNISNNAATFGGGILARQGVNVTVNDSTISGNSSNRGGGVYSLGTSQANVININRSTISNNTAVFGGGGIQIDNLGAYSDTVTVTDSTISGNVVTGDPADPANLGVGGGIMIGADAQGIGNLVLRQSTVSGNSANNGGGGIYAAYYANVTIDRSTITNNKGNSDGDLNGFGGGLRASTAPGNVITISNSIIAGNVDSGAAASANPDLSFSAVAVLTATSSFIGTNKGAEAQLPESPAANTPDANGNLVGGAVNGTTSPQLGLLSNNGGTTLTHLPNAGSPVIDRASGARTANKDQRGATGLVGPKVDMGSVEVQAAGFNLDFNNDTRYDCGDMDLLESAIDTGSPVATFDVNGDSALTSADVFQWLVSAGAARFGAGRSFRNGDANLDGVADGSDFGIWNANKFTNARRWCTGDFNQDNVTDGSDFGIWNANKFTASDASRPGGNGTVVTAAQAGRAANSQSKITGGAIRSLGAKEVDRVIASIPRSAAPAISVSAVDTRLVETKKVEVTLAESKKSIGPVVNTAPSVAKLVSSAVSAKRTRAHSSVDQIFATSNDFSF